MYNVISTRDMFNNKISNEAFVMIKFYFITD